MNLFKLVFFLFLVTIPAYADDNQIIADGSTVKADLDNGAFITLPPVMNFTTISIYDSNEGIYRNYLRLDFNGSQIWFNSNFDKTISEVNYSSSLDVWTFKASGTSGYLNVIMLMQHPNTDYSFVIDNTTYAVQKSGNTGEVSFVFNTELLGFNHQFLVGPTTVTIPFISSTGQSLSWWVLLIIFIAVIGLVLNYKYGKMSLGKLIALTILVIAIGVAITFVH